MSRTVSARIPTSLHEELRERCNLIGESINDFIIACIEIGLHNSSDFDFGDESNRFASKKPAYHRLDMRATAYTTFWNIDWSFYLDVINVYNRQNVIGYDYFIDENLQVREKTIGQFPILPTIGLNARF